MPVATSKPNSKIPASLGACADRLADLDAQKAELNRQVKLLDDEIGAIEEHIIQTMPKGDTGAKGRHHQVTIKTKVVASVKDWDAFYAFIARRKLFHFLQRRPAETAIKELWDAGKAVPGVEPFTVVKVSLTKV